MLGMVTLVSFVQFANADVPIEVTPSGITTEVASLSQEVITPFSIFKELVTGCVLGAASVVVSVVVSVVLSTLGFVIFVAEGSCVVIVGVSFFSFQFSLE